MEISVPSSEEQLVPALASKGAHEVIRKADIDGLLNRSLVLLPCDRMYNRRPTHRFGPVKEFLLQPVELYP